MPSAFLLSLCSEAESRGAALVIASHVIGAHPTPAALERHLASKPAS